MNIFPAFTLESLGVSSGWLLLRQGVTNVDLSGPELATRTILAFTESTLILPLVCQD